MLLILTGEMLASDRPGKKQGYNQRVLTAVSEMPTGGEYAVGEAVDKRLASAMWLRGDKLLIEPEKARPSYCSAATYLVLLKVIQKAQERGEITLNREQLSTWLSREQKDGVGVWGRWNANGPGAAVLLHDLKIGRTFESFSEARSGDFMKIFWSDEIGKKEFGHLVVYLGTHRIKGEDYIRFWSSNKPGGYGEKSVLKKKVKWALFTRLEDLKGAANADLLAREDPFLQLMLKKSYSQKQVRARLGIKTAAH